MTNYHKKNIIFITNLHLWSLDANKGGKAFYLTVNGYIKAGWNVTLISTGGNIPAEMANVATVIERKYEKLEKWAASPVFIISVFARYLQFVMYNRFYYRKAIQVIQKLDPKETVVYAYEVTGVRSAKKISQKFGLPLVTRFQGTVLGNIPNNFVNRIRRTPHFSALQTHADLVIMTNDGTQGNKILSRLNNKSKNIVFWRNGVDCVDQYLSQQTTVKPKKEVSKYLLHDSFVFLTVSRLVDWKRVHLAINGFATVQSKYPNTELIIVGEGAERENLERLTLSLGLKSKITFTGAVPHSEIREIMQSCDAFLSFYDLSNLGNPIMEAMISGLPVITIDVGDTSELIKNNENGLLIPANQLNLIPVMMEKLLLDIELRHRLANSALRTALSEFISWDQRIENEVGLVQKLISE